MTHQKMTTTDLIHDMNQTIVVMRHYRCVQRWLVCPACRDINARLTGVPAPWGVYTCQCGATYQSLGELAVWEEPKI